MKRILFKQTTNLKQTPPKGVLTELSNTLRAELDWEVHFLFFWMIRPLTKL